MFESNKKTNVELHLDADGHFPRPRINSLLEKAIQKQLVIVCAGAGYGKTHAVYDFTKESGILTSWIQCSELDNTSIRFWEGFIHTFTLINKPFANEVKELGFPDTEEKLTRYIETRNRYFMQNQSQRHLYVFDDFHLIKNPDIIRFMELVINNWPEGRTVILICRDLPEINIQSLQVKGLVQNINEEELTFTETELGTYLSRQGLSVDPLTLNQIFQDIDGWAFAINLIAQSLAKSPGYFGYTRNAVKLNISSLIESEVWGIASEQLKHFWVCLSLIEHLPKDLISSLVDGDESLLAEFQQQNAYIRYDSYTHTYRIHHLFLDFLRTKQDILNDDEKRRTYSAAARWCMQNSYIIDALGYCEKIGDYESIVSIFCDFPFYLPYDFALYGLEIFKRVPDEMFYKVDFLAVMHLRVLLSLGMSQEFTALSAYYEQKFLELPEGSAFKKHTLGLIWYLRGFMSVIENASKDYFDFDKPFAKIKEYLSGQTIDTGKWLAMNASPGVIWLFSARKGAPQDYLETASRLISHVNPYFGGFMSGLDELGQGEMKFYQGDIAAAAPLLTYALKSMRENKQFDTVFSSLFYTMRVAFVLGKQEQAEQALEEIKALLNEEDYTQRFINCDIAVGWYHYLLRQPEKIPSWLKDKCSPYGHAFFPENFGNQMKVRYHYMTKNFAPVLAYIEDIKQRELILFDRIEMLAIEACVRYQMKDRAGAFKALREAYETAAPNDIIMPFIEMGKDMRTLTLAALRDKSQGIPDEWLKTVNRRASYYAKNQVLMVSENEGEIGTNSVKPLSPREAEILQDLCNGFSRSEIAEKQQISISTVKMNISHIAEKLKAKNTADIVRIATEQKLV